MSGARTVARVRVSRVSHAMPDHVISWIRSQPEYKARYVGAVSG